MIPRTPRSELPATKQTDQFSNQPNFLETIGLNPLTTTQPSVSGSNKTLSMMTKEWRDFNVGIISKGWTWNQPQMDMVADFLVVLFLVGVDFVVFSLFP